MAKRKREKDRKLATRNTTDNGTTVDETDTITKAALAGLDTLNMWLDDPAHYVKQPVMRKGKKVDERMVRRNTQATAVVPEEVYVALVQAAAANPGALDSGDLVDGAVSKAVRGALAQVYAPTYDMTAWEDRTRSGNIVSKSALKDLLTDDVKASMDPAMLAKFMELIS